MDLSTRYLGLSLPHPLIVGASPLVDDLDVVRRLEDAGAAAIVMHSLFEEQLIGAQMAGIYQMEIFADAYSEALSYFPQRDDFALGPDEYLRHIGRLKEAVDIPIIGSLNGTTPGGWTDYARLIQQAGADALELNIYEIGTSPAETGRELEDRLIEVAGAVRRAVTIPVAIKLSPFFSSLAHMCARLDAVEVDGLVLFNRFYQPDIDMDNLEAIPKLGLSDSHELLVRLRWLAILSPNVRASLAVTGGVHTSNDALKSVMAGAHAVQLVSCLLKHGPEYIGTLLEGMRQWMREREYVSIKQMHGSMSHSRCPDPRAYERANYMRILQSWKANQSVVH